jgi:hypothetical protein
MCQTLVPAINAIGWCSKPSSHIINQYQSHQCLHMATHPHRLILSSCTSFLTTSLLFPLSCSPLLSLFCTKWWYMYIERLHTIIFAFTMYSNKPGRALPFWDEKEGVLFSCLSLQLTSLNTWLILKGHLRCFTHQVFSWSGNLLFFSTSICSFVTCAFSC